MTDKLEIPDPATLEGEALNYWCGKSAKLNIAVDMDNLTWIDNGPTVLDYTRWNPIEDAAQCWELTPRCHVVPLLLKGFEACVEGATQWGVGETELIARCRAYLASKRKDASA